ncbi:hypothetical protein [Mycobacterium sp. NPDC004974]
MSKTWRAGPRAMGCGLKGETVKNFDGLAPIKSHTPVAFISIRAGITMSRVTEATSVASLQSVTSSKVNPS